MLCDCRNKLDTWEGIREGSMNFQLLKVDIQDAVQKDPDINKVTTLFFMSQNIFIKSFGIFTPKN